MNKKYNSNTFSIINKENKKYIGINNRLNKFYNNQFSNQILGNNDNIKSNNIYQSLKNPNGINIYNNTIQNKKKNI